MQGLIPRLQWCSYKPLNLPIFHMLYLRDLY